MLQAKNQIVYTAKQQFSRLFDNIFPTVDNQLSQFFWKNVSASFFAYLHDCQFLLDRYPFYEINHRKIVLLRSHNLKLLTSKA